MATSIEAIKPARPQHGSIVTENDGALQTGTFEKGAVLVRSSGLLTEGGTDPTSIVGVAVHGQETAAKHSNVLYVPARPDIQFEMTLTNATDVAADTTTTLDITTHLDAVYGITEDADGHWYVDTDKDYATDPTDVRVRVVKAIDADGTENARVRVIFLPMVEGATVQGTIWGGSLA